MDRVFSKYSCPFVFLDGMINSLRFLEFVDEFQKIENEKTQWDFYLHKVFTKSFDDFKSEIVNKEVTKEQIETTVQDSKTILMNFVPI